MLSMKTKTHNIKINSLYNNYKFKMKRYIHAIYTSCIIYCMGCSTPEHNNKDELIRSSYAVVEAYNNMLNRNAIYKLQNDSREESQLILNTLETMYPQAGYSVPSRFISSDYFSQLDSLADQEPYTSLPMKNLREAIVKWRYDLHQMKRPLSLDEARLMRAMLDNLLFDYANRIIQSDCFWGLREIPYVANNGNIIITDPHSFNDRVMRNAVIKNVQVLINDENIPTVAFRHSTTLNPLIFEIDKHAVELQEENVFRINYTIENVMFKSGSEQQIWQTLTSSEYYNQIQWK